MPMSSNSKGRRPASNKTVLETGLGECGGDESIGYLSRYAYRAFVKVLADELAQYGILTGQWSVLRILWEEEGLSQVELADRMRVEKASLTNTLDGMERLGLITRKRNSEDRRKVNIFLTAKGQKLKDKLLPYAGKINRRATKGMSVADAAELRTLLLKVIANLET